jgi:hypothetical protein
MQFPVSFSDVYKVRKVIGLVYVFFEFYEEEFFDYTEAIEARPLIEPLHMSVGLPLFPSGVMSYTSTHPSTTYLC